MMQKLKSWIEHLLLRDVRELGAPVSKGGFGCSQGKNYSTQESPGKWIPGTFTSSTIVIDGGWAEWELEIPEYIRKKYIIRKRLTDATLKIETIHTHGTLHSPFPDKQAWIYVNDVLVDSMKLEHHPHGGDYRANSQRPFSVLHFIDEDKSSQTIRVEVDKDVAWDIDRVTLELLILRKEITPAAAMFIGAIISAVTGGVVSLFI